MDGVVSLTIGIDDFENCYTLYFCNQHVEIYIPEFFADFWTTFKISKF